MHMISKKDLSNAEMDTLTKSCSPTIVITANGEVQIHEEAVVYVKELDIFLTMQVLDNTPAVLSPGKLCGENGYSYEWINGRKPHLIKNGISATLQYGDCGSTLVKFVLWIFINFTDTYLFIFFILTFFTYSRRNSGSRKGKDAPNTDISPVPVSELVDDRSGTPEEIQPRTKTPKTNKKETTIERCDSEIPEWLQEFRENLVDDEIPLQGGSHASSSHEDS